MKSISTVDAKVLDLRMDCLTPSLIYPVKGVVTTDNDKPISTYIRLTESIFQKPYANHKTLFSNGSKRKSAERSKFV